MNWLARMLICAAVLMGVGANLAGQETQSSPAETPRDPSAHRFARVDAMRKIAERITDLRVTSGTFVRDFTADSDMSQAALEAYLAHLGEAGEPKFLEDGTCEVTVELSLPALAEALKKIHTRYYEGDKFKAADFDGMPGANELQLVRETGIAPPRTALAIGRMQPVRDLSYDSSRYFGGEAGDFWSARVTPVGRLSAVRQARKDAMRRLAEQVTAVYVSPDEQLEDFITAEDPIDTTLRNFLRGARETGVMYHDNRLIAEVRIQVRLRTVYMDLRTYVESRSPADLARIELLEDLIARSMNTSIEVTGLGAPAAGDLKDGARLGPVERMIAAGKAPAWINWSLKATGRSAAADGGDSESPAVRDAAFRWAAIDAMCNLAQQVGRLGIRDGLSVAALAARNEKFRAGMRVFMQGAREIPQPRKLAADGTVEVTMEIDLRPLWDLTVALGATIPAGPE